MPSTHLLALEAVVLASQLEHAVARVAAEAARTAAVIIVGPEALGLDLEAPVAAALEAVVLDLGFKLEAALVAAAAAGAAHVLVGDKRQAKLHLEGKSSLDGFLDLVGHHHRLRCRHVVEAGKF